MTVAVLIPTYCSTSTIDAALASVAAQSAPPDEVVVVDDNSSDDTPERVLAWADRLPITLLQNQSNVGVGTSRRRGVSAATSDFIALLDHDDVWFPDHLETLTRLAADRCTIAAPRVLRWLPGKTIAFPDDSLIPHQEHLEDELFRRNYIVTGAMFPRAAFMSLHVHSPSRTVDDWESWIRLVVEANCHIVVARTPTLLYRSSPTQASSGDGCLLDEIDLLERLLAEPAYRPHRRSLEEALERRHHRVHLLAAFELAAQGHDFAARKAFLRVALRDRSLRGGAKPVPVGSLTLRALLGCLSPRRALERRSEHLSSSAVSVPATAEPTPFMGSSTPGLERLSNLHRPSWRHRANPQ